MARSRATQGNNAQFTYDFGIAIAQSTVNKVTRLTGATLTLASAFYALRSTATQYVDTLRENTLRFGGVLSTMKAMEQAQDRLIKGQSYFNVDDQLRGMNQLMAVGVKVGENLDWINKAAHATGKSFAEFSGMIASAIQGNSQALVDAGLMTQRATRMFDKYAANTVMRQQAILNFVKNHKGLMNAIKNDFETIQDQMTRIRGIWQAFLQSVVGKPNDPQSFYGQVVSSMKMVATALARNMEQIRRYGYVIGQTLGWVIRQIGHFVVWVGRQAKRAIESVWSVTDNFQEQTRSLLVWLEFWKLEVLDFFKEYGGAIKNVLKLLITYKALKYIFVIGQNAIKSVLAYKAALIGVSALQRRYIQAMGPFVGKTAKFFQSLAVWMPRPFRKAWIAMFKFFADFKFYMRQAGKFVISAFAAPFKWLAKGFKFLVGLVRNLPVLIGAVGRGLKSMWIALNATNPIGWIMLAITLLTVLYAKSRSFRNFVNSFFKTVWESIKLIWNSLMYLLTWAQVGIKKIWEGIVWLWNGVKGMFSWVWNGIQELWSSFMNTKVGKWINTNIVQPLMGVFDWISRAWDKVVKGLGKALDWLGITNDSVSQATKDVAEKYGVVSLPTIGGGDYNTNDTKNYLNPFDNSGNGTPPNPITDMNSEVAMAPVSSSNSQSSTNMNFSSGAVQIIVQKGEGIDEGKLARKVEQVIFELKRKGELRGGIT